MEFPSLEVEFPVEESRIFTAIGEKRIEKARTEAGRRRLLAALGTNETVSVSNKELQFVADGLNFLVLDRLEDEHSSKLTSAAADVFQIARVLPRPNSPLEAGVALVRLGCLGVLGDRSSDVQRLLVEEGIPSLPVDSDDWGERTWATILDIWLRVLRKDGWADLDEVQNQVVRIRSLQTKYEPGYLKKAEIHQNIQPAWELINAYHLAKAAEIMGMYISQGSVEGHFDIREQLESQFDRAISAVERGYLVERDFLSRLLARTAKRIVDNSIWAVTRGVNSHISTFVKTVTSRSRERPMFELLPPQRLVLRDEGLLGSSKRSIVVNLPTSSGKTFIAEFRILQALNQFEFDRGWVAYLAPTRALVNQLTTRLRKDFSQFDNIVEKIGPALEIGGHEESLLNETDEANQFRILVTTPEKFDLMIRGGWEEKIGRPLTLVVVDEAHALSDSERGIKLELLLATINRECQHAQFLLLTPFIHNTEEIAQWLAPDSNSSIDIGVHWVPNDRSIVISTPKKGESKGDFTLNLETHHTNRNTIEIPETIEFKTNRPLDLIWSGVSKSPGQLAAATAQTLKRRGPVVILVNNKNHSWGVAKRLKVESNRIQEANHDIELIQQFLADEMGGEFPLPELIEFGIGVHHSGLSDDTRTIIEWLTEKSMLSFLVATTTIAQGVNFPVSAVVFASHQYPYGQDMPPEDFWNVAGRVGRVDQGDLGIVALAAPDEAKQASIKEFIGRSVSELNSTLVDMIQHLLSQHKELRLELLYSDPAWSTFLQYLIHSYRQIGNHEQFVNEIEQVLRGSLGFQTLRKQHRGWADLLIRIASNYAQHIKGKQLDLVDATGFSLESINHARARLNYIDLPDDVWSPKLFGPNRHHLAQMMNVLLNVPELSKNLNDATRDHSTHGSKGDALAQIICDWVQGNSLPEIALRHFSQQNDSVKNITNCCSALFGKLIQSTAWGLSALQLLITPDDPYNLPSEEEHKTIRNLPARIYYGVNSDEAILLRMLGVPRNAASPLSKQLRISPDDPLHLIRSHIKNAGVEPWEKALGSRAEAYHRVWAIVEGEA